MANEISAIKVNNVDYSLRDSSKVEKNQAITGATKCKITYDSKGLVTGGANLEASDIPSLGAGKITSGTFDTTRIPSLAASKITSGTFDAARIPDLSSTYSVVGHNHNSSYVTSVAAITSVSDRGCIEVTKNGSSTYIKVNGWDALVNSIPSTPADIGAAASDHTHTITLATDSGTPAITLSHSATYKLTAGGKSVIFKTPSDNNTNYYHTPAYSSGLKIGTGTGVNDMYVPNGSTTASGVLQIGTGATNAAAGNHNHDSTYLKLSGGNLTGHLYLTGSSPSSSTSNTSQLVFGTSSTNHVVVSSNDKILVINPTTTTTTGQILLQVGSSPSIKVNGTAVSLNGHTHSYAGSSSAGGAATSAVKLTNTSKIGDTNKPVYFTANGVPAAISYTIGTNVPSDAVFTDTNYYHTPSYSSGIKIATGTGRNDLYVPTGTAATNVAVGNHTHTISLAASSSTPTITLSNSATYALTAGGQTVIFKTPSGGSGGSTLYRHNLEWVVKTGSSPNYDFIHFYGYIITNSSTAYTASSYFGNITTLFKKTVLTGGFMDAGDADHYAGIEAHWLPSFNKNNNLNGVYINYRYVGDYDTYYKLFYTTTPPYAFTDHVEPNCDLS